MRVCASWGIGTRAFRIAAVEHLYPAGSPGEGTAIEAEPSSLFVGWEKPAGENAASAAQRKFRVEVSLAGTA